MSIRDIIEAALVSSGNSEVPWAEYYDCPDAEAHFIATFDPEHISLMEAVCEAAEEWVRECQGAEYQDDGCTADSWGECERPCAARVHLTNLQAYRKECGL